jgi:hypothetical protein
VVNRVRIISMGLAGVGDGLDQISLVSRRLVCLAYMSLARLRDFVISVTLEERRSATGISDALQGLNLPPIGKIYLSTTGVGLLPVVPLLAHSG